MENFNKIISFVLGLVVVIVFLAVISRKVDLKKTFVSLSGGAKNTKVTPTPSPKKGQTIVIENVTPILTTGYNGYQTSGQSQPKTIPSTGAPTVLIPIAISSLFAGLRLKRTGKK